MAHTTEPRVSSGTWSGRPFPRQHRATKFSTVLATCEPSGHRGATRRHRTAHHPPPRRVRRGTRGGRTVRWAVTGTAEVTSRRLWVEAAADGKSDGGRARRNGPQAGPRRLTGKSLGPWGRPHTPGGKSAPESRPSGLGHGRGARAGWQTAPAHGQGGWGTPAGLDDTPSVGRTSCRKDFSVPKKFPRRD